MGGLYEDTRLRNRTEVFPDRETAGEQIGLFLRERFTFPRPVVCPIPAGGIPIGIPIARTLDAPLRPVVVRKIQIPWNTESGFGAVTWTGDVVINQDLLKRLHLSSVEIERAISRAKASVEERIRKYASIRPLPDITGRTAILTDDGLASGFTMRAAIDSIRLQNPERVVVAVPTGSLAAVRMVSAHADDLICLNIRGGFSFAVADAYSHWHDLSEEEVRAYLDQAVQEGLY
ncbi:MAG: phosphoribosyltransferase [Methanomicrobiales archaeon]|nr:phosphoribosyltransferase [Methanomicrobiales archaeon]